MTAGLIECTLGLKMPMAYIYSNYIHGLGMTYKLTPRDDWNRILGIILYSLYVKICSTFLPNTQLSFQCLNQSVW